MIDDQNVPEEFSKKIKEIINQLDDKSGKKSSPLRMYRNRVLNHYELKTSLGKGSVPKITTETIEESLSLIKNFMNTVRSYYGESETSYSLHQSITFDGSNLLISVLKDGIRYRKIRDQYNKTDISNHVLMDDLIDNLLGNKFKDA